MLVFGEPVISGIPAERLLVESAHDAHTCFGQITHAMYSRGLQVASEASDLFSSANHQRTPASLPIAAGISARSLRMREPEVTTMLSVLLDRYPGAFIDVGVNFGQTLLNVVTKSPSRASGRIGQFARLFSEIMRSTW